MKDHFTSRPRPDKMDQTKGKERDGSAALILWQFMKKGVMAGIEWEKLEPFPIPNYVWRGG